MVRRMPRFASVLRRPSAVALTVVAASFGCRQSRPDADYASQVWADASNRDNQLKELVVRYQESTKRIEDYQVEMDKVDHALRAKKEALAAKRVELAKTKEELAAATAESDAARAAAAAARQHAAESRKAVDEATKEVAELDKRKADTTARLEERRRELAALDKSERELKAKLAAAVDRAVVLRESTSGSSTPRLVRLTLNSVRRDGVVSVVARGTDRLKIGDVAEVRRDGTRVGKLTLIEEMVAAAPDSDGPAIYAARFEAEQDGVTPSLTDEITAQPPDR
jgi:hypothetical protein